MGSRIAGVAHRGVGCHAAAGGGPGTVKAGLGSFPVGGVDVEAKKVGRTGAVAAILILSSLAMAPQGLASHAQEDVVVAVLDSGIRETHETFEPGQVVAWKDFLHGEEAPYDDAGHGTAVASMVAGQETEEQTPSHAPGTKLAVGKVLSPENGVLWSDLEDAIYWAVDEVGADAITLSVYSYTQRPGVPILSGWSSHETGLFQAIEHAWEHGVFVTILSGNGLGNAGTPTMSYMHPPATSPHALIVGGADETGTPVAPLGSMEPEVTAPYYVDIADDACDTCYRSSQGTSYASPLVAGMAARLLQVADAEEIHVSPDRMQELLTHAAEDTPAPPTLEGYGFLDDEGLDRAEDALLANTTPDQGPTGPVNDLYVENVQRNQRQAWYGLHGG